MVTRKNDEAVSPVIGVILMVAITVILAAVIAAFVFGMSGNISKTKIVASTVTQKDANNIVVTYNGGQDDQTLGFIKITNPDGVVYYTDNAAGHLTAWTGQTGVKPNVGATSILTNATTGAYLGQDHIVVVGVFTDGVNQVIADTYV